MFVKARPPKLVQSTIQPKIAKQRAADMDNIVGLPVRDLFGDIREAIYVNAEDDLSVVRHATEETLANVDMSMIKPNHTINLLCTEHGFSLMGGAPYAEMLRTIKDIVEERTGCKNIRLRFACGERYGEASNMLGEHGLDKYFKSVMPVVSFDEGIAIETEIGTLYGLKSIFDADWFIHSTYSDPREFWFNRLYDRILKIFTMAYARIETRSTFHMNFSSRSSNIVPRAIFDSPFIQQRHAFTCVMETSPAGVTNVVADRDLHKMSREVSKNQLRDYGKMVQLFKEVDECVVIFDGMRWAWYVHGGGIVSGTLFKSPTVDYFNLDISGRKPEVPHSNPAVKAIVINYAWPLFFMAYLREKPTTIVGEDMAIGTAENDWTVRNFIPHKELREGKVVEALSKLADIAPDLESAIKNACEKGGTDKIIVFDGGFGNITVSRSMGELLMERAPIVAEKVDKELLPLWLKQRGLD